MNPVILINDPVNIDYSNFILSILPQFSNASGLDLLILSTIDHSQHLNEILYKYYSLIRKQFHSNYEFEINILFNLKIEKVKQLNLGWNKGYITDGELTNDYKFITNMEHVTFTNPQENFLHDNKPGQSHGEHIITACGGTFDHLHEGHKILLSMSLFLTKQDLIIGITGEELLKNKKYKQVLQSFDHRKSKVIKFLQLLISSSRLNFEIYEINDICGPTGYIENIDSLIISHETRSGGEFINNYRRKNNFRSLEIVEIKVIGDDDEDGTWKNKLSSTDIRKQEYEKLKLIDKI